MQQNPKFDAKKCVENCIPYVVKMKYKKVCVSEFISGCMFLLWISCCLCLIQCDLSSYFFFRLTFEIPSHCMNETLVLSVCGCDELLLKALFRCGEFYDVSVCLCAAHNSIQWEMTMVDVMWDWKAFLPFRPTMMKCNFDL